MSSSSGGCPPGGSDSGDPPMDISALPSSAPKGKKWQCKHCGFEIPNMLLHIELQNCLVCGRDQSLEVSVVHDVLPVCTNPKCKEQALTSCASFCHKCMAPVLKLPDTLVNTSTSETIDVSVREVEECKIPSEETVRATREESISHVADLKSADPDSEEHKVPSEEHKVPSEETGRATREESINHVADLKDADPDSPLPVPVSSPFPDLMNCVSDIPESGSDDQADQVAKKRSRDDEMEAHSPLLKKVSFEDESKSNEQHLAYLTLSRKIFISTESSDHTGVQTTSLADPQTNKKLTSDPSAQPSVSSTSTAPPHVNGQSRASATLPEAKHIQPEGCTTSSKQNSELELQKMERQSLVSNAGADTRKNGVPHHKPDLGQPQPNKNTKDKGNAKEKMFRRSTRSHTAGLNPCPGVHKSKEQCVTVTFNVIVPVKYWDYDKDNSRVSLHFGHPQLGEWKCDIGEFSIQR